MQFYDFRAEIIFSILPKAFLNHAYYTWLVFFLYIFLCSFVRRLKVQDGSVLYLKIVLNILFSVRTTSIKWPTHLFYIDLGSENLQVKECQKIIVFFDVLLDGIQIIK